MSLKIEIFPVRADSAFRKRIQEHRNMQIYSIYTKIDIKSGLDYTEHVHDCRNSQLLLEKTSQLKQNKNNKKSHKLTRIETQTAEKPLDITNCMMHYRLFTEYLIQNRLSQHKRIICLNSSLWHGKHQPPWT